MSILPDNMLLVVYFYPAVALMLVLIDQLHGVFDVKPPLVWISLFVVIAANEAVSSQHDRFLEGVDNPAFVVHGDPLVSWIETADHYFPGPLVLQS